ncbi:hypothetical protein [Methylobacterium sp. SyP6R]|uniref:hypothetical protein n=1 Tax=Methylobacterium sp. SyP6R TaxID=2718876 RepID=UPI001F2F80EA|nr:hypothetical protein [Methylobacterium sp. SyP6R]MCF4127495.1 hypothetical protein [Methylobacterium sp. SyP6R]
MRPIIGSAVGSAWTGPRWMTGSPTSRRAALLLEDRLFDEGNLVIMVLLDALSA